MNSENIKYKIRTRLVALDTHNLINPISTSAYDKLYINIILYTREFVLENFMEK